MQQQANAVEKVCQPLVDQVKLWEEVAAAEYAADGDVQGWEAEQQVAQSSEDRYIQVRLLSNQDCCRLHNMARLCTCA